MTSQEKNYIKKESLSIEKSDLIVKIKDPLSEEVVIYSAYISQLNDNNSIIYTSKGTKNVFSLNMVFAWNPPLEINENTLIVFTFTDGSETHSYNFYKRNNESIVSAEFTNAYRNRDGVEMLRNKDMKFITIYPANIGDKGIRYDISENWREKFREMMYETSVIYAQ